VLKLEMPRFTEIYSGGLPPKWIRTSGRIGRMQLLRIASPMKSYPIRSLVCFVSSLALSVCAGAQTTVATFNGTLSEITETSPFWSGITASASIEVGTPFTLTVTYDPLTADFTHLGAELAIWQWHEQPGLTATIDFGDYHFEATAVGAEVYDRASGIHGFVLGSNGEIAVEGITLRWFNVILADSSFDYVDGLSLDAIPNYDLSAVDTNLLRLNGLYGEGNTEETSVFGVVSSYSVSTSAVPEPASAGAVFAIAGLACASLRRRSRRA
jgi:hypothetical protein